MKISGFRKAWPSLPVRSKGLLVLTFPLFAVLAVVVGLFLVHREQDKTQQLYERTLATRTAARQAVILVLEAEFAMRAYALTGDRSLIEPFLRVQDELPRLFGELRSLAQPGGGESGGLMRIQLLTDQRMRILRELATLLESPRVSRESLGSLILSGHGAMEDLRREAAFLQEKQDRQLAQRKSEGTREKRSLFLAIGISVTLTLSGGFLVSIVFTSGIVRRIQRLQATTLALAQAEPVHSPDPGVDEIGLFAQALEDANFLLRSRDDALRQKASQLVASEQAFRNQNAVLESILKNMGDGVVVSDIQGKLWLFNTAAEQILGKGPVEIDPEGWSRVYGCYLPDTVNLYPSSDLPLTRALEGESVDGAEVFIRNEKKTEGAWVSVNARPLRSEDGRISGGVLVFRDVTAMKLTQENLLTAKEEAEEANRAKSEFLSRMSHELRTPLNAILGFAQVLEMDEVLDADQMSSVDQILKGGRHLLALISEVLDIARIEAGQLALVPECVPVRGFVLETLALMAPLAATRGIELCSDIPDDSAWRINADPQRFKQVLMNILSNAIKYNRENGKVTVGCAMSQGNRLRLEVSDTGIGIPARKMYLLFSPFERLDAPGTGVEGYGIGLAVSKKLVEAMGGAIGAASEFGQGSIFWMEFPLVEEGEMTLPAGPPEQCPDPQAVPDSADPARTVLYIEDNLSNFHLVQRLLAKKAGVKLISAMQGRLGLDLARQHRPDLILLDLHLPDLGGDQVLQELKADPRTRSIPVAMVSADATQRQIDRLLAEGATAYLTKPLDVRKLLEFLDATWKNATVGDGERTS